MLPKEILASLAPDGKAIPIAGGDVNQNYRIITDENNYFLKFHPGIEETFFQAEINGLKELADFVRVPQVYNWGQTAEGSYLVMEWIEPGEGSQEELAATLSTLHHHTQELFGFYEDNYIGVLPQVNAQTNNWVNYFFTCRLDVQVELAKLHNVWNPVREEQYLRLKEVIYENWQKREVAPSLLHGDFWSGNYFFDKMGQPVLIDPAVSYGDREMDLAMAQLFGGFRAEFFQTYQDLFPLATGWEQRQPIYQLYYLLVHLNQFGESYGRQVDEILQRFN